MRKRKLSEMQEGIEAKNEAEGRIRLRQWLSLSDDAASEGMVGRRRVMGAEFSAVVSNRGDGTEGVAVIGDWTRARERGERLKTGLRVDARDLCSVGNKMTLDLDLA
jgi:hypothetical protein